MLPQRFRLRARRDFERVYRGARSWADRLVVLHVLPQASGRRVGLAVGKKIGGAVARNRVRRRLREIVRARIDGWREGFDAVFVARRAAAEATFPELGEAVDHVAGRARLPREPGEAEGALYHWPAGGRQRPGAA